MDRSRALITTAITATLPAWQTMVGPHVEVVLHDLDQPERSVIHLFNGHVTGRKIGDSLLGGPLNDKAFLAAKRELSTRGAAQHSVITDYPTLAPDGRPLKSATVVFRDAEGIPFLALCMNADLAHAEQAVRWIGSFLGSTTGESAASATLPTAAAAATAAAATTPPLTRSAHDLRTMIQVIVEDAVTRLGKPVDAMSRDEKLEVLRSMVHRGVLLLRGGVGHVARALGVTRYTVYNYLDLLRERDGFTPER